MELLSKIRAEAIGFAPPEKPGNTAAAKPDSYASVGNFTNFSAVCQPFEGSERDFLRFVHRISMSNDFRRTAYDPGHPSTLTTTISGGLKSLGIPDWPAIPVVRMHVAIFPSYIPLV